MPSSHPLKHILLSAITCLLPLQPASLAAPSAGAPISDKSTVAAPHAEAASEINDTSRFEVIGGRGPKHCALAVGVMIGGAIGFWGNPIFGASLLRFGLMAAVTHCA